MLGHFLTVGLLIRLCWWKVLIGQFCLFADGQKKGTLYSKSLRPWFGEQCFVPNKVGVLEGWSKVRGATASSISRNLFYDSYFVQIIRNISWNLLCDSYLIRAISSSSQRLLSPDDKSLFMNLNRNYWNLRVHLISQISITQIFCLFPRGKFPLLFTFK